MNESELGAVDIDGSFGEGGGQILRSSLALSLVTGRSVEITKIRAGRARPGLARQHLTAVRAAAAVSGAQVSGDALGSGAVSFRPGIVRGGEYHFSVGTAGSASLVLQTVLVPLLLADEPSTVSLGGGTDNPSSPPVDFLAESYLPLIRSMGPGLSCSIEQHGFFPAGGGRFTVRIEPVEHLRPIELLTRGEITSRAVVATVANLPATIAERELSEALRRLDWPSDAGQVREAPGPGPGNTCQVRVVTDGVTSVFTGFGVRNRRAERVARQVARETQRWLASQSPVEPHLADQLLLPMAVAGSGRFVTTEPSSHTRTHAHVIERFLPVRVRFDELPNAGTVGPKAWRVEVVPSASDRAGPER